MSHHSPDRNDNAIAVPRGLTEKQAAGHTGFSPIYLRSLRVKDTRRIKNGEPIEGPPWVKIGRAVRYMREDLDAWLNAHRVASTGEVGGANAR